MILLASTVTVVSASAASAAAPSVPSPALAESSDNVVASWDASPGADRYYVYWSFPNGSRKTQAVFGTSATQAQAPFSSGSFCAQVSAKGDGGQSALSERTCLTLGMGPPPAPTWRSPALNVGSSVVTAQWNDVSAAGSTNGLVEVEWTHGGATHTTDLTNQNNDSISFSSMTGEVCAKVRARGLASGVVGPWSTTECFTPTPPAGPAAVPAVPSWQSPAMTYSGGSVRAAWNASVGATRYYVYWTLPSGGTAFRVASTLENSWAASTSSPGDYCARIRANGPGGTSGYSSSQCFTVEAVVPPAPTWRSPALNVGSSAVTAQWNDVSAPGSTNGLVEVEWTHNGATHATDLTNQNSDSISYSSLTGEVCAKVRARGLVSGVVGPWSTTECFTPAPPVTQPPVTQPPVTQPPVTQPPVTQPPVTQPPVTQPPVTQPPVTQPPVTQAPSDPPVPTWRNPAVTFSAGRLTARWNPPPTAENYWVDWTLPNGERYSDGAPTPETTLSAIEPGRYCISVRAVRVKERNGNVTSNHVSRPSTTECFTVPGGTPLATPTWQTPALKSAPGVVLANWNHSAGAERYFITWSVPGGHTYDRNTTLNRHSVLTSSGPGTYCATLHAAAGTSLSAKTEQCLTIGSAKLPAPSPAKPTVRSTTVTATWPAVSGAFRYEVKWAHDGVDLGKDTAIRPTDTVIHPAGTSGLFCVTARSIGATAGNHSDWSAEQCVYMEPPVGSISGTVRADGTSAAIGNILVCASSTAEGAVPHCSKSGSNGAFRINGLVTANYSLDFNDPEDRYLPECWRDKPGQCTSGSTAVGVSAPGARTGINAYLAAVPPPPAPPSNPTPPSNPGTPVPSADTEAPQWFHDQVKRIPPWIAVDLHKPTELDISWCCSFDSDSPNSAPASFDVFVKRAGAATYDLYVNHPATGGSGSLTVSSLTEGQPYSIAIVAIDPAGNRSGSLEKHNLIPQGPGGPPPAAPGGTIGDDPTPTPPTPPDTGGGDPDPTPTTGRTGSMGAEVVPVSAGRSRPMTGAPKQGKIRPVADGPDDALCPTVSQLNPGFVDLNDTGNAQRYWNATKIRFNVGGSSDRKFVIRYVGGGPAPTGDLVDSLNGSSSATSLKEVLIWGLPDVLIEGEYDYKYQILAIDKKTGRSNLCLDFSINGPFDDQAPKPVAGERFCAVYEQPNRQDTPICVTYFNNSQSLAMASLAIHRHPDTDYAGMAATGCRFIAKAPPAPVKVLAGICSAGAGGISFMTKMAEKNQKIRTSRVYEGVETGLCFAEVERGSMRGVRVVSSKGISSQLGEVFVPSTICAPSYDREWATSSDYIMADICPWNQDLNVKKEYHFQIRGRFDTCAEAMRFPEFPN